MAKKLKYANEEFEKIFDEDKIPCARAYAYYFFLQGFSKGLDYDE